MSSVGPAPTISPRARGLSTRLKLTLSYAGVVLLAGGLILVIVWAFLLRYVPSEALYSGSGFVPGRADLVRVFGPRAALAMGGLVLLGLVGGWFLAGRMLAPLAQIGVAAREAGRGNLSYRIRMTGKNDEFRELSDAVDRMLGDLDAHVGEQQRFAANASHELRTPLAITHTLLEVARADPPADPGPLLDRLAEVNRRATQLADALLLLSRTHAPTAEHARVDLSLAAEQAAENVLPLAEKRGLILDVRAEPTFVLGSEALLHQMVVNLLHNAIVHNHDTGGSITVLVDGDADNAVLRVENTGERVDVSTLATVFEPFQRGHGRTRTPSGDHAGAGLGLPIVRNIVTAHAGRMSIEPRRGGGVIVTVRFPRTAPPRRARPTAETDPAPD